MILSVLAQANSELTPFDLWLLGIVGAGMVALFGWAIKQLVTLTSDVRHLTEQVAGLAEAVKDLKMKREAELAYRARWLDYLQHGQAQGQRRLPRDWQGQEGEGPDWLPPVAP